MLFCLFSTSYLIYPLMFSSCFHSTPKVRVSVCVYFHALPHLLVLIFDDHPNGLIGVLCWLFHWGTRQVGWLIDVGEMNWMMFMWYILFFYLRLQRQKPTTKNWWLPTAKIWADAMIEMSGNKKKGKLIWVLNLIVSSWTRGIYFQPLNPRRR